MQETRYIDEDGSEKRLLEFFYAQQGEHENNKLLEKMNRRLFELEQRGHVLVGQRPATLADKLAYDRAKKAKKKLVRMGITTS